MGAGLYNFTIEQGSTFTRLITYRDANNALVDLTNYTARMQLRKNIKDTRTIIELTTENNRITLGGLNGTIQLSISAADTKNLETVRGVYDLEIVAGTVVTKIIAGEFNITGEVTR